MRSVCEKYGVSERSRARKMEDVKKRPGMNSVLERAISERARRLVETTTYRPMVQTRTNVNELERIGLVGRHQRQ